MNDGVMFNKRRIGRLLKRRRTTLLLWGLALVSSILILKSSGEPAFSSHEDSFWAAVLAPFPAANQIVFDVSVGFLSGLLMYVFVVWMPEQAKRRRLRRDLATQYETFKEGCITIYFSAMKESYNSDLVESLKDQRTFQAYFKEPVSSSQTRWDQVANGLNDTLIDRLVLELEVLRADIHYTLTVVNIDDDDTFVFFRRFARVLAMVKPGTRDYDGVKSLLRFLWQVHTGWSFIDGYRSYDVVDRVIAQI